MLHSHMIQSDCPSFNFSREQTTLLNVLAERISAGVIEGGRYFNGRALPVDFQAQTGYCQQMDTHVSLTTVREALRFSARLRQPASVPTAEKDA
jgi:ATP-binding cassette subfamily G (WHITE) protein 2 (SNQ2)